MAEQATIEIPEVSDAEIAFGTTKHLPPWNVLTEDEKRMRGPFCDITSKLFFNGGEFSEHGLVPKPGIDAGEATLCIYAHLRSWEPKHEHKIGGVGHLLAQWFDIAEPEEAAKT